MPIVLTINDKILNPDHQWNDIVGVQYHYPNQYKNKVIPGEQFVYYRGCTVKSVLAEMPSTLAVANRSDTQRFRHR